MPSEEIGTCGDAQWPDRKAIGLELEFGISCLRRRCGPEPPGCSLEVVWHEHDSGAYATISLVWEQGSLADEHWKYIDRCSETLDQLDDCVDWDALHAIRETEGGSNDQERGNREAPEGQSEIAHARSLEYRIVTAVSAAFAAAVLVLAMGAAPKPFYDWPSGVQGLVVLVAAVAAALPWGLFFVGRWLCVERWPWKHISIAVVLIALAWFVWPTSYKSIERGLTQVNRFTGAICRVGQSCW